jgi:hypothetical protein
MGSNMVKRLEPKSMRGQTGLVKIVKGFDKARDTVKKVETVNLSEIGIDWNNTILDAKGKAIGYHVGNPGTEDSYVDGKIRNMGYDEVGVEVYNPQMIGIGNFSNDDVISYLAEAITYTGKLNIVNNEVFLPSGKDPNKGGGPRERSPGGPEIGTEQYRIFAAELLNRSKEIIVGQQGKSFGDYIVAEMPSGFFVAYNKAYGEAPYVVTDLDILLQDKQTIIKNGDAIRFRRDRRAGSDWTDRLLNLVS